MNLGKNLALNAACISTLMGILAIRSVAADDNASAAPTFSRDVAPIFQKHCMECHRPGEIAPMALTSYEEARPWAKSIRTEVAAQRMPPWHADRGAFAYANDESLSEKDIKTIVAWVDSGAAQGDPKAMPKNPDFSTDWKLGKPDVVLQMPLEYEIGPEGDEIYHCFVMPEATEDRWVDGVEFRPGNRAINHHVVLFLDGGGKAAVNLDNATEGPGYPCFGSPNFQPSDILGVWAPGANPDKLPEGVARWVPKGSRIVMQLHYHRNGKLEHDKSEVGLHYAKGQTKQRLRLGVAVDFKINLEAGQKDVASIAQWRFTKPAQVRSLFPHMHLIGKTIGMTAFLPDGTQKELLAVSRYDFNWQRTYEFAEPVSVPAGTRVEVKAIYDNSADNPRNPNKPPIPVKFGFATTDEMNVGFVYYTEEGEDLTKAAAGPAGSELTVVQ